MLRFPQEFPGDAIGMLLPLIRSGELSSRRREAGEAALTIQGYAMGQVLRASTGVRATAPHPMEARGPIDDDEVMRELENYARASENMGPTHPAAVGASRGLPIPPKILWGWIKKIIDGIIG